LQNLVASQLQFMAPQQLYVHTHCSHQTMVETMQKNNIQLKPLFNQNMSYVLTAVLNNLILHH